jgi:hypothetical protein
LGAFFFQATMKKPAARTKEKKTPGTAAVEKYRPRMNRPTDAEREKLLAHAMADDLRPACKC